MCLSSPPAAAAVPPPPPPPAPPPPPVTENAQQVTQKATGKPVNPSTDQLQIPLIGTGGASAGANGSGLSVPVA